MISAVLWRSSFSMIRARCVSTVLMLRERSLAISLLLFPSAINWKISRSRSGKQLEAVRHTMLFQVADVVIQHHLGHRRAEERLPFAHGADGLDEIVVHGIFQQVSASAGAEGLQDVTFVHVHAQNQNPHVGSLASNLAGRFSAVQVRHGNVHDDHIRLQLHGPEDGFPPVMGFRDHLPLCFFFKIRRKPCRTSVWSSANRIRSFFI